MTLPVWSIPVALSVLVWLLAVMCPIDGDRLGIFRLFVLCAALVITLIVWLIYFMVT